MQDDVRTYIAGCEKCSRKKDPNRTKQAPMQIVRSGYPFERIAVDILGDFPITERGNKYILVMADYFTKWTECFPMPNMEAETIAKILVNEVISRFGIPDQIHSDQGRQFESNLFKELCKLLQINKTRTTPYHPQSDGMVERFNMTLVTMLSAFVDDHRTDWDEQIPYVLMAYRSSEHETTGVTPNLLMLGRETTMPLDIMFEMPPSIKSVPVNQWVWQLNERLEMAHSYVRQTTGESMRRQKKVRDRKQSYEEFQAGNNVYVYFPVKPVGLSWKLTPFWKGPFQVLEKVSGVLYKVNCGRNKSPQIIHCDRMKSCKGQILRNEELVDMETVQNSEVSHTEMSETGNESELQEASEGKRIRRKPFWTKDYVLSTFSSDMAKEKTTERKYAVCPACRELVKKDSFTNHLLKCSVEREECTECGSTFKKKAYLQKHMRTIHGKLSLSKAVKVNENEPKFDKTKEASSVKDDESEKDQGDDWDSDPDISLEEDRDMDDLIRGRLIRKPTSPLPVPAPKKSRIETVTTGHCPLKRNALGDKETVTSEK
ncbi:MAG: DDE-type integrase/transposase/recombinase, partial [Candidatus Thiodiazotropha endolucinida]|nr:DDE-type integrase/transposase/recombinase [Candidatus Thiodiazotropha taylori]MCW4342338.1 DDE-type integrase/transposase/recombinase [Candidatus Thiodiazotropha endolucinida]